MIPTDLFLVTHAKDFGYLRHCLRSIGRFCKHFNYLRVLVPKEDEATAEKMIQGAGILFPARAHGYEEAPGKGMLMHMVKIMYADTLTDGQHIAHLDADCIFTGNVTPEDFIENGKIIIRYEPWDKILRRHSAMGMWRECTDLCLPFPTRFETMRAHPGVFHRDTYGMARSFMKQKTNVECADYILKQRNEFPQTFCEFNTLGNVAMLEHPEKYIGSLQKSDMPMPDNKLQQFWSHGAIDQPQDIWVKGVQRKIIPIDFIEQILGVDHWPSYQPTAEDKERMHQ